MSWLLLYRQSLKKFETFWDASTFTAIYPPKVPRAQRYNLSRYWAGANKDLMASQLLQIHIKDVPSNNFGRQVAKVDDRVGVGEGVLITWVVLHHTAPKLCSILRPNFKVVPVHLLSLIIVSIIISIISVNFSTLDIDVSTKSMSSGPLDPNTRWAQIEKLYSFIPKFVWLCGSFDGFTHICSQFLII